MTTKTNGGNKLGPKLYGKKGISKSEKKPYAISWIQDSKYSKSDKFEGKNW